ncbi:MAG: hypothetical protein AAF573_14715 [Bacteroidota bacterium]
MDKKEIKVGQPTPDSWQLTNEERLNFQALYILYLMTEDKVKFPNFLTGHLRFAQDTIEFLEAKKLIRQQEEVTEGRKVLGVKIEKSDVNWFYEPTPEARNIVAQHRKRFRTFLTFYDVYAHVDPEAGEFAFSKMKKILLKDGGAKAWEAYKNQDRWVDYRVPVAVYKGIDPREFIFFSFMEEGRFIPTKEDQEHVWAKNLFVGNIWEELNEVMESAPRWEDQGDAENPAKEIMETIIVQGAEVLRQQRKKLKKFIKKQDSIIGLQDELEAAGSHHTDEDEDDYDDYYHDPVYYHGHYYTPLADPFFWVTAAIIL